MEARNQVQEGLELTVKQVLTQAYSNLSQGMRMHFVFPRGVEAFVTDDDDSLMELPKAAFIKYSEANLITVKNQVWIIANGNYSGSMTFSFDSDILAIPTDMQLKIVNTADFLKVRGSIEQTIGESRYFFHSVVFSTNDGLLYAGSVVPVHQNPFEDSMKKKLLSIIPDAFTKLPKDKMCLDMDYKHRAVSNEILTYKPWFPKELSDKILATLQELS